MLRKAAQVQARDILQKLESQATQQEEDSDSPPHFVNSLYAEANMEYIKTGPSVFEFLQTLS